MVISKTKKYKGVYKDSKGKIYFQIELGVDPITGKRIQKKGRKNQQGLPFNS
ncbi:TPA: site-specific integrase, partial [Streptococcus pneumoniae]|nr:site-specific integrase [Streptococcus pneumoniae]